MQLVASTTEQALLEELRRVAVANYGPTRARELETRLSDTAHVLWLISQERLDLLDEEPDRDGR